MEVEPVWSKAFIEIALRAIRRLHINYGTWGLGQEPKGNFNFEKLNQGPGIEVALEPDVCAAISQEFINSRFTNGAYFNDKHRHYEIDREVSFTLEEKKVAVDLFIDRYQIRDKGVEYFKFPAIIQAKRAYYYTPQIATGDLTNFSKKWDDIKTDIEKIKGLKEIDKYRISREKYQGQLKGAFLYTLFWGIYDLTEFNSRQYSIEILGNIGEPANNNLELRWMPLIWDNNNLKVSKWLWLALYEIEKYSVDPDPDDPKNWFITKS